jgi:hypothetical protein
MDHSAATGKAWEAAMKKLNNVAGIIVLTGIIAILVSPTAMAGVIGSDGRNNVESIGVIGSDGSANAGSIGVIGSDGRYSAKSVGVIGSDGNNQVRKAGVIGSDGNYQGVIGSDGKGVWSVALSFSPRLASLIMRMGLI